MNTDGSSEVRSIYSPSNFHCLYRCSSLHHVRSRRLSRQKRLLGQLEPRPHHGSNDNDRRVHGQFHDSSPHSHDHGSHSSTMESTHILLPPVPSSRASF